MDAASGDVLLRVFQTREELLKEISRCETRVVDLESALKQQGLVTLALIGRLMEERGRVYTAQRDRERDFTICKKL